ncbi:MAG: cysteine-rich CWC family protein, partial [Candidatus Omnitrophica bacterium]|nr:cysteine-rich CWC family protein [Candidatus Omnitrophota bacterium]
KEAVLNRKASSAKTIHCERCGKAFVCDPEGDCWCKKTPLSKEALERLRQNFNRCLCPDCLRKN